MIEGNRAGLTTDATTERPWSPDDRHAIAFEAELAYEDWFLRVQDGEKITPFRENRAHVTTVQIGHRNSRAAEVLSGLSAGEKVVLHPSDRIADGSPVSEREPQ